MLGMNLRLLAVCLAIASATSCALEEGAACTESPRGCAQDLVCLRSGAVCVIAPCDGDRCYQPCRTDGDCSSRCCSRTSLKDAETGEETRYCGNCR